jgi:hypothetical protein
MNPDGYIDGAHDVDDNEEDLYTFDITTTVEVHSCCDDHAYSAVERGDGRTLDRTILFLDGPSDPDYSASK